MMKLIATGLAVLIAFAACGATAEDAPADLIAKAYAAKNDKLKAQELAALERELGGQWSKLNARFNAIKRQQAAAKARMTRAAGTCETSKNSFEQKRARAEFNEAYRIIHQCAKAMMPIESQRTELAARIEKRKAEIIDQHVKRKAALDKVKETIGDGQELTEAEMLAAYEQALN